VRGTVALDSKVVEKAKLGVGRFILATNNLSLSPEDILTFYKDQAKVEKCFRYLKGKELRISEVLLKKPERIQGLCCFMALVMLISTILEMILRTGLKQNGKFISNQLGKPTDMPTLQLAFDKLSQINGHVTYKKDDNSFIFKIVTMPFGDVITVLEQFGENVLKMYTSPEIKISYKIVESIIDNIDNFINKYNLVD
jgi:hypothetical protein